MRVGPGSIFPSVRTPFEVTTKDGVVLVGEVAAPLQKSKGAILCLHPLPTAGGMMDSHIYKKAANRLPAMADLTVVRFNTRGTTSDAGTSTGEFDNGIAEHFDVEAMLTYCFDVLKLENVWVVGWSFGTDLALQHAKDPRHKGLILLSPPLRTTTDGSLSTMPRPRTYTKVLAVPRSTAISRPIQDIRLLPFAICASPSYLVFINS